MSESSGSETSVSRLFRQDLRAEDARQREQAAARLWGRYAHGLLGYVRVRMDDFVRQQASPESVLQVTFEEVLRKLREGKVEPQDRNGLLGLLRQTAKRRLIDKAREVKALQRNPAANRAPQAAATDQTDESAPAVSLGNPDAAALEAGRPLRRPEKLKRAYRKPVPADHLRREPDDFDGLSLDALLLDAPPDVRLAAGEAFDLLDEPLQITFLLWIQQFSEAEIAEQLGIEPENVMLNVEVIQELWSEQLK